MSKSASTSLNMAELAQRCNVSRTTVGRVLNNKLDKKFSVRPEVRDRILKCARELGFRPNLAAMTLAQARTGLVAVMGYDHRIRLAGVCHSIVRSLVDTLRPEGLDVFVTFPSEKHGSAYELPPWRVDGAVLLNASSHHELRFLEAAGIPYVSVNGVAGPSGVSIMPDDRESMAEVVDYLVRFGHRRIAYAGPLQRRKPGHLSETIRHEAYLERIAHHDLVPMPGHDRNDLSEAAFIDQTVKAGATALIAYDHHVLIPLSLHLNRRQIAVPDQLSLVCFNDEYLVDWLSPPVSAVSLPSEGMGAIAGRILLEHIQHGRFNAGQQVKVDTTLIERESVKRLEA